MNALKSFISAEDAINWVEKLELNNVDIEVNKSVKGFYYDVVLKSFEKHNLNEKPTKNLNDMVSSGHLMPMINDGKEDHHMVSIGGRHMVLANINGQPVPFYHSTGKGGKADVQSGKWYPVLGLGHKAYHETKKGERGGTWINKTKSDQINDYYGSPHLAGFAKHLDSITGNLLGNKDINSVELEDHHDATYDGFMHPKTGERLTRQQVLDLHKNEGDSPNPKFIRHPEGSTNNFMKEFTQSINNKMGITGVNSAEQKGGYGQLQDNIKKIVNNIETSQTPNINLPPGYEQHDRRSEGAQTTSQQTSEPSQSQNNDIEQNNSSQENTNQYNQ